MNEEKERRAEYGEDMRNIMEEDMIKDMLGKDMLGLDDGIMWGERVCDNCINLNFPADKYPCLSCSFWNYAQYPSNWESVI